ncbi:neutral/alkaline non-lysosomal ceramidase N-terminal domain-containing protein [Maribellus sp. CM-23]|uniref:neutral/alkaline non-lysosomal ceramidase N-terminal domain-containing protein n=1 Tax=Maribellus sp. CM-23 TaxID=2781026 RepID=UPI001F1673C9|nr:neutral/alkaline non-lysosomal ceramidase N-terminal domain-containing protein [Maribellus sp. CM-23]MCE4565031.1 neutral/alkaline non-lysosomal ceramidase N-terminal domain-containing protein [Maribellus sp. CM-23]
MKINIFFTLTALLLLTFLYPVAGQQAGSDWKAGVAKVKITPHQDMWMAGYASRTSPSEGTLHELWAKALFLEDAAGQQVLLVTADLLGFPKTLSDQIRDRLEEQWGLSRSQIILNSSHTHSGPVLANSLSGIYLLNQVQQEKIDQYTQWLEQQIYSLCEKAARSVKPARVYASNGVVRFQVNRRNNDESQIAQLSDLQGPNDYAVPVLKVENMKGRIQAVAFGYACHPTVLNGQQWSGDYPGFAQIEIENKYKGATALFFQGAGADQNPMPRRTVPLAKQYGQELAAAVERVLHEDMYLLRPGIQTAYSEIELEFDTPPTKEYLLAFRDKNEGFMKAWAEDMLGLINSGTPFPTSYPYPVQVWKLGEQTIVALGGELLVNYSVGLKKALGNELFVMGYSNDVMAYIPDEKVLKEGRYEGEVSQMVYGLPARWKTGIEQQITDEVIRLAKQLR